MADRLLKCVRFIVHLGRMTSCDVFQRRFAVILAKSTGLFVILSLWTIHGFTTTRLRLKNWPNNDYILLLGEFLDCQGIIFVDLKMGKTIKLHIMHRYWRITWKPSYKKNVHDWPTKKSFQLDNAPAHCSRVMIAELLELGFRYATSSLTRLPTCFSIWKNYWRERIFF